MNRSRTAATPAPERQIHYAWIVLAALLALRIGMGARRQGQMAAATA